MAKYAIEFQSNNANLVSDKMMNLILSPEIGYYGMGWFIYDNGTRRSSTVEQTRPFVLRSISILIVIVHLFY